MKSDPLIAKVLAGVSVAMFASLFVPAARAGSGSGVSIWRFRSEKTVPAAAPAPIDKRVCADSRVVRFEETVWVRAGGRGPRWITTGERRVCNSCAPATGGERTPDRNGHGPKAGWIAKATHDCGESGCGTGGAGGAVTRPRS